MLWFSCDYLEGCHPKILEALQATNLEQTAGYGEDRHCRAAADLIRKTFAVPEAAVHFLMGGTQANLTVIASLLAPYEGGAVKKVPTKKEGFNRAGGLG